VGAGVAVGVQAAMTTEMRSRELIPMCLRFRFIEYPPDFNQIHYNAI